MTKLILYTSFFFFLIITENAQAIKKNLTPSVTVRPVELDAAPLTQESENYFDGDVSFNNKNENQMSIECHQEDYGAFTQWQISQANKILRKNCFDKGDNNSCYTLGKFYLIRMHRDVTTAKTYFDKACERNHLGSCYRSNMLLEATQFQLAKQKHTQLCHSGHANSCHRLGGIIASSDVQEAKSFYTKGCNLQNGPSCVRAAELSDNSIAVSSFLSKGCNAGSSVACRLKNMDKKRASR